MNENTHSWPRRMVARKPLMNRNAKLFFFAHLWSPAEESRVIPIKVKHNLLIKKTDTRLENPGEPLLKGFGRGVWPEAWNHNPISDTHSVIFHAFFDLFQTWTKNQHLHFISYQTIWNWRTIYYHRRNLSTCHLGRIDEIVLKNLKATKNNL